MKPIVFFLTILPLAISAQDLKNFSFSNGSGIYSVFVNPALSSCGTDWLSFNLAGTGASLENNGIKARFQYSLPELLSAPLRYHEKRNVPFYIAAPRGKGSINGAFQASVVLPSVKWNPNPGVSVFFYVRERATGSFNSGSASLVSMYADQKIDPSQNMEADFEARLFAWQERAIGISGLLYEEGSSLLSMGVTFKKVRGRFASAISLQDFTAHPVEGGIKVNGRSRLIETDLNEAMADPFGFATGKTVPGEGFSADIGFVYELRPSHLRNRYTVNNPGGPNGTLDMRGELKYLYRISFSCTDMGRMVFSGNVIRDRALTIGTVLKQDNPKQDIPVNELQKNMTTLSENRYLVVRLPVTLNISIDRRLNKKWYLLVNYSQNLRKKSVLENAFIPSQLLIMPHKELRHSMLAMPVRIATYTRSMELGLMFRTGPFFLGLDNLNVLLLNKVYNLSAYAGICFTIRYRKDPTQENFIAFR